MLPARLALPLMLALGAASITPAQAIDAFFPEFGNRGYEVQHYALNLSVDPGTHKIDGRAVLTIRANAPLKSFALDLSGLQVRSVRVDGKKAGFMRNGGKLRIRPAATLPQGSRFKLEVAYDGVPAAIDDPTTSDPTALKLGWLNLPQRSYVVSEPVGASSWYPVNDEPTDKASYETSITVAKPYVAVSNGDLRSVTDLGQSRRFVWKQDQPMASYLSIVDIDRYKVATSKLRKGLDFRTYTFADTPPATLAALAKTGEMLKLFEQLAGPYPFDAYGSVLIRDPDLYYALETQAMSTFPNEVIGEGTVAHELAHQWYGDSVTVAAWRDLWLAEGFATYFELAWENRASREAFDAAMADFYADVVADKIGPAVVSRPEDIFSDSTYKRGALTLQALRLRVGDKTFARVLRAFHATYKGRNASSADFIRLAVKESRDPGVRDLLQAWLFEQAVPPLPGADAATSARGPGAVQRPLATMAARRH